MALFRGRKYILQHPYRDGIVLSGLILISWIGLLAFRLTKMQQVLHATHLLGTLTLWTLLFHLYSTVETEDMTSNYGIMYCQGGSLVTSLMVQEVVSLIPSSGIAT